MGIFYNERQPSADMQDYVAYYWMLRFSDTDYPVKTTPPDAGSDIVIDLNTPFTPVIFGQSASFFPVPTGLNQNIFGIRLKPGVAKILLSSPANLFFNAAVRLSDVIPQKHFNNYIHILEKYGIDPSSPFDSICHAVQDWLESITDSMNVPKIKNLTLLKLVENMDIYSSINDVKDSLDISARQIERRFHDLFGLTPKTLLRILRFQSVLSHKNVYPNSSWADICVNHGYYDQSHLCRDFNKFTGMAPEEYFSHYKK